MSHFNKKTLTFYGTAIGSVLILFSLVTRYGNTHLKAPVAIGGDYILTVAPSSACPSPRPLRLSIQQSGVYLSAALWPDVSEKAADTSQLPFTLNGNWQNGQIDLTGRVPGLDVCSDQSQASVQQDSTPVQVQGTLENKTLSGQMSLGASPEKQDFTARVEESAPVPAAGH